MTNWREVVNNMAESMGVELILLEGPEYDAAIVGVGEQAGGVTAVVYSGKRIIQILMDHHGMDHEDAWDWFGHNIQCMHTGPGTPMILSDHDLDVTDLDEDRLIDLIMPILGPTDVESCEHISNDVRRLLKQWRGQIANAKRRPGRVFAGFPGVGKSYVTNLWPDECSDSDSSAFSWAPGKQGQERHPEWPQNYIDHIKQMLEANEIVFVSTHAEVLEALAEAGIAWQLLVPSHNCKEEYLERYAERGSPQSFIDLLSTKWGAFIEQCQTITEKHGMKRCQLGKGIKIDLLLLRGL